MYLVAGHPPGIYGVFFNVTTFAAGTKPAQIYDLCIRKSQIKPGKSFGILTMEYVSHKLTIVPLMQQ